jgi:hypothetical protein
MAARRRGLRRTLSLAILTLAAGVGSARADILQDLGATFEKVAAELAGAFPKVEVHVVAAEGEMLRVEGAGIPSLRPGLELSVFRRGEVYRHPITGQVLSHAEQELGTLVVTAMAPGSATGRFVPLPDRPAPGPGDGARITAGRLGVAVLPTSGVQAAFESADQTQLLLVARFSALLEKTGRFQAVDPQRVLDVVGRARGSSPSALETARRLGGVAVLSSRLVREGKGRVLEATWTSGRTGATLAALRTPLVPASFPPRFAWEETPELERRYPLDGPVRALALGDLDGDGRTELVVGDEQDVLVYRVAESGVLMRVDGASYRPGGLILSLDVAVVAAAGRAQLVVVDQRGEGRGGVRSHVLEWTPTGFRVVHEVVGRYLRVIRFGAEAWLVEQPVGENEPFEPEMRRLVWDGQRFRDGARLALPRGVSVYGVALLRLGDAAEPSVIAMADDGRLGVWTGRGRPVWVSTEPLGGSAVTFEFLPSGGARRQAGEDSQVARVAVRVMPLPSSGDPEVLVYENLLPFLAQGRTLLPRLAATLFNRGRVVRFRWRDGAFIRVWQSSLTQGYIADLGYGDLDGDGLPEVVVGVVPRGLDLDTLNPFGRLRGQIVAYELP